MSDQDRTLGAASHKRSSDALEFAKLEYTLLGEARRTSFDGAGKRFEQYLVMVSVTAVAAGIVVDLDTRQDVKNALLGILMTCVAALGFATFGRLVELELNAILYTRGLNRLRSWFASQAPELRLYFVLPLDDRKPPFLRRGFLTSKASIVAIINSAVIGTGVALAPTATAEDVGLEAGLAIVLATILLTLQITYLIWRSRRAATRYVADIPELDEDRSSPST